jgi:hypothetical protein
MKRTKCPHEGAPSGAGSLPIRRHEGGYVVQGPGFYIWDEDPREVLRAAREIQRGGRRVTPTARLLILRDDFENCAS